MALRDDAYVPTLRHGQASHDWRFDSIANVNRVEHEEKEGGRGSVCSTRGHASPSKTFDVSEGASRADLIETFPGTRLDLQFDRIYQ